MISAVCALVIGGAFFTVFAYTVYLDGQCQQINKYITETDQNIYKLQREIQNLKIKMESYSRKEYIVSKINRFRLNLRTPDDYQVVDLSSGGLSAALPRGETVASYSRY